MGKIRSRLHHSITHHINKHQKYLVAFGLVVGVVLLGQLFYPSDKALPFARLNGDSVGFHSKEHIYKRLLTDYSKSRVTSVVGETKSTAVLTTTGVIYDGERIMNGVSDYPWYLRIIPFSSFIKGALTDQEVVTKIEKEKFSLYASERAKECYIAPKNAGVMVKDGEIVLDPAKDGADCPTASLAQQFSAVPLEKDGLKVVVKTTPVKPERSDRDVSGLLKQAKEISDHKITISSAGKIYEIDKPTLAGWLSFPEDPATKTLTVGVNESAVTKYLETIQKDIYIAPGTTYITTQDGIETSRVNGAPGQGIDIAKSVVSIRDQVLKDSGTVTVSLASLPPKQVFSRSYSKTPEGLQALVNDLAKDKGDYAISVRKLGDNGVHANGDKQYHPASTYKLYVAYSVMKRIDAGSMSWGQASSGGQTVSQCFDNMIVNSDNACAEWFGKAIGWSVVTSEVRAIGLTRTQLSSGFVTTANDLAIFLQKLESNQIGVSEPSRARLLDAMKRQVFRQGIPAGVGVPTADKVGFLDGMLHDASIVYSPSGVYVLVVMSKGSSWAQIADTARQIQQQLQ